MSILRTAWMRLVCLVTGHDEIELSDRDLCQRCGKSWPVDDPDFE